MAISLQKGQRVDLTKGNAGLSKLMIGLGWDPVEQKKGGLFGGLLGGAKAANIDCDASVLMLSETDKLVNNKPIHEEKNEEKNFGVLPYVAPEILLKKPYTLASDVYSFGIIAYELLNNSYPYYEQKELSVENLGVAIYQGLRPRFNIKIPKLLEDLINKC